MVESFNRLLLRQSLADGKFRGANLSGKFCVLHNMVGDDCSFFPITLKLISRSSTMMFIRMTSKLTRRQKTWWISAILSTFSFDRKYSLTGHASHFEALRCSAQELSC